MNNNSSRSTRKFVIFKKVIIFLFILFTLYAVLSVLGASAAINLPRLPVKDSPYSVGLSYENVSFQARDDNITLKGWFIPGEKHLVVIIIHGGFQNRVDKTVDTLPLSRDLVKRGYSILLFDLRGRGESEGKGKTLSYINEDIEGAVDFLKNRGYSSSEIALLGFCSGAASACIFASFEDIGGLVLDGCFASVKRMFINQASSRHIPMFLSSFFYGGLKFSAELLYDFKVVDPQDVIHLIKCPIFLIHEEHDKFVSEEETLTLYHKSASRLKLLWEIPDANHSEGYVMYPEEYINRIDGFLKNALLVKR